MTDPLIYGDYEMALDRIESGGSAEDPRLYANMGSFAEIRPTFDRILESYNVENKAMNLVLFEQALEHLTRVLRVLKQPRGNLLLIGVGGSGKQSVTRLSAFTAGYSTFEITLSRGYGEADFREELKELYKALVNGPTVFLFTDAHVVEEGVLEIINNM